MQSKSQTLARNTSRFSGTHEYSPQDGNILVGNTVPIGSASIDQVIRGSEYSNVQDALGDVVSAFELPINSVITNEDGVSPAGVQQVDTWTFTGTVKYEDATNGTPVKFHIFGIPVEVNVGETADEVTSKTHAVLGQYVFENRLFANADAPIAGQIEVTYLDYKRHVLDSFTDVGITVTPSISSPSKGGYGTWDRLGAQTITFDNAQTATLHYFKRIA